MSDMWWELSIWFITLYLAIGFLFACWQWKHTKQLHQAWALFIFQVVFWPFSFIS